MLLPLNLFKQQLLFSAGCSVCQIKWILMQHAYFLDFEGVIIWYVIYWLIWSTIKVLFIMAIKYYQDLCLGLDILHILFFLVYATKESEGFPVNENVTQA